MSSSPLRADKVQEVLGRLESHARIAHEVHGLRAIATVLRDAAALLADSAEEGDELQAALAEQYEANSKILRAILDAGMVLISGDKGDRVVAGPPAQTERTQRCADLLLLAADLESRAVRTSLAGDYAQTCREAAAEIARLRRALDHIDDGCCGNPPRPCGICFSCVARRALEGP